MADLRARSTVKSNRGDTTTVLGGEHMSVRLDIPCKHLSCTLGYTLQLSLFYSQLTTAYRLPIIIQEAKQQNKQNNANERCRQQSRVYNRRCKQTCLCAWALAARRELMGGAQRLCRTTSAAVSTWCARARPHPRGICYHKVVVTTSPWNARHVCGC